MKKISFLFLIIFPFCVTNVKAQEIDKAFRKATINEDFSSNESSLWKLDNTGNNLYLIQNGEYVLYRKDKRNADVIFPKLDKTFSSFHIKADFMFDKHNKDQSVGLVFMAQEGGAGALMVEINDKREYRLRKLQDNKLRNLYYSANDGWMKSDLLINDMFNTVEVVSYEKVYDLYINGTYIRSFSDLEYKEGNVGLYVAPNTKVRINNFAVYEEDAMLDVANDLGLDTNDIKDEPLTAVIVSLNAKVKKLQDTIKQLQRELIITKQSTTLDSATQAKIAELEKKVEEQSAELASLKMQLDKMSKELIELRNYKKNVESAGNGDIIENLSKTIETEQEKNKKKQEEIDRLKEENKNLRQENKDLKTQVKQLGGGEEEEGEE